MHPPRRLDPTGNPETRHTERIQVPTLLIHQRLKEVVQPGKPGVAPHLEPAPDRRFDLVESDFELVYTGRQCHCVVAPNPGGAPAGVEFGGEARITCVCGVWSEGKLLSLCSGSRVRGMGCAMAEPRSIGHLKRNHTCRRPYMPSFWKNTPFRILASFSTLSQLITSVYKLMFSIQ